MQKFGSYFLTALTVVLLCCMAFQPALTQSTATIAMSQKFYSVGEGMVVNGSGFTPGASINLTVQRPDQVVDSITGVFADSTGKFAANYAPPQEPGRYRFTATDGVNTAKTAITSADAIGYNKGVYNKGDTTYSGGGTASGSNWTTGNAGSNYLEGQWAFYQYEITGVGTTIPDADIAFNHFQSNTNAIFVDGFANIRACFDCTDSTFTSGPSQGMLTDANFAPPTSTTNWVDAHTGIEKINHPFDSSTNTCLATPPYETPATVYQFHCMHLNGGNMKTLLNAGLNSANGTSGKDYFATGTHTVTIYYAAHLASTSTWTKGFEYLLGCTSDVHYIKSSGQGSEFIPSNTVFGTDDYNPTAGPCGTDSNSWTVKTFFGIGSATGSSRHFLLENQSLGSNGGIDLPIPSVPAPTGSITIVKVTVPTPATGATFSFTGDLGSFNLDTDTGTATPSSQTFSGLSGGTVYNVGETALPSGWQNSNIACVNNTGSSTFTYSQNTSGGSVAINLANTSGAAVTCTFTNTGSATLKLVKNVLNNNGGTAVATSWTTSASGPTPISGAGGVGPTQVNPGTYTLSESGSVTGYTNGTSYSCVNNGGTPVTENSITLAPGDNAVCTITNSDNPAHLQLIKNVQNDNGGTAPATSWTLSASGPTPLSGAGGVANTAVSAGTYNLSESGTVSGYTNGSSYSCVKNGGSAVSGNSISLSVGDSAVCTITNHDNPAHLQLIKHVQNNNGGTAPATSWTLSASGPTPLSGAGGVANTAVTAGTYNLSESGTVAGYTNGSSYSCVKNGGSAVSGNSITLGVGDSGVCTITNSDSPAHLQLVKNVQNDNGGTAPASSWTLSASGPTPLSGAGGTANTAVNAGTYNLSESGTVSGYTNGATYSCVKNGGSAVSGNSVVLGVGDSAVCTITNHDNPAHLQLIKSVQNNNGGTALATSWTLSASGPTPLSGAGGVANTAVTAGTYNLSESGTVSGYTNGSSYSCVKNGGSAVSGNSITLGVGDSGVCTITNSDNPAHLALVKNVVNNYGGIATASSWTLSASGPTPLSGAGGVASTAVTAGTYNLSESGSVAGYTNGSSYSCVKNGGSAVSGNSIVLGVGDTATCTISNHDNPATIILRKNTVGGNGSFNFTATGNGLTNATINTVGGTGSTTYSNLSGNTAGGARSFSEVVPTGWIGNGASCAVTAAGDGHSVIGAGSGATTTGGTMSAAITTLGMGATVTCTFTNDLLPTLSIVKTVQGTGTATFTFPVTGANTLSPTITPPAAPAQGSYGPVVINVGASTISEQTPPAGWTLTDAVCTGASGGVVYGPNDTNGVPTNATFTASYGDNVVCSYVNNNAKASRTQGFWATHTSLSNNIWNGTNLPSGATGVAGSPDAKLCGFPITAVATTEENVLMGGFWSQISKTSTGGSRTAIDKNRMQMLQQYLAAVLNYHMFGSIGESTLAAARTAYCGTNATAIQNYIGILGNLNQAGDLLGTTPGGSATAQASKKQADINAWDIPQFPELSDEDAGTSPHLATVKHVVGGTAVATNFTLKAACSAGACGTTSYSGLGGFASTTVSKGVYTLTDSASSTTTGYTPGAWTCTGSGNYFVGATTSGKATLAVGYGATVSCDITNTHP